MDLTRPTPLSSAFVDEVHPAMCRVTEHEFFRRLSSARATLGQCRKGLLGFFPLVEAFPRYMGLTLERLGSDDRPRADEARAWLEENIRTEGRHARWWRDWGRAFGISADEFQHARATPAMDAPNHYLREVARSGSVAEAVAAVNYAIEGTTGVWTRTLLPSLPRLGETLGLALPERSLRWVRAHARYDDRHPIEALEIVKVFAADEATRSSAARAAIRSLEFLVAALDDALVA
jgi:pyrroloquinoline quinone (PQQ) biosynthesis protein C